MELLKLAYDPGIPSGLLAEMERAARRLGLPLATVERLGQDETRCRAFVVAARQHDHRRLSDLTGVPTRKFMLVRPRYTTLRARGGLRVSAQ